MMLDNCKVVKTPVYHFHDGFLKFTGIMSGKFPKRLRRIEPKDQNVALRFYKASVGWLKYKPLLLYIRNKKEYRNEINKIRENLKVSIPVMNNIFKDQSFDNLLNVLDIYDQNVQKHYKDFQEANRIWNKIKMNIANL